MYDFFGGNVAVVKRDCVRKLAEGLCVCVYELYFQRDKVGCVSCSTCVKVRVRRCVYSLYEHSSSERE